MITFRRWEAAPVNALLARWGHYLGGQNGPRMVLWYGLFLDHDPVAVAVSASPRGATCAGIGWQRVVELARLCSHPEHRDLTRVALRCWRVSAARDWANAYDKELEMLAAYSDSTRHPGNIYRADGWELYDERLRGSGGQQDRSKQATKSILKKLWIWRLPAVVIPAQQRMFTEASET